MRMHDLAPARLVKLHAENVVEAVASGPALVHKGPFLLSGARHVFDQLRRGHLRKNVWCWRQERSLCHRLHNDIGQRRGAVNAHVLLIPTKLQRPRDAQGVLGSRKLWKLVAAELVGVHGRSNRGGLRDELNHQAVDRLALRLQDTAIDPVRSDRALTGWPLRRF